MIDFTLDEKRRLAEMMGFKIENAPGIVYQRCVGGDISAFRDADDCWVLIEEFDPENNPAHCLLAMERLKLETWHEDGPLQWMACTHDVGDESKDAWGIGATIGQAVTAVCKKLVEKEPDHD